LLHIIPNGISADPQLLNTSKGGCAQCEEEGAGWVNLTVTVRNDGATEAYFSVGLSLIDDSTGVEVGSAVWPSSALLPPGATRSLTCEPNCDTDPSQSLRVRAPSLWSIKQPSTYTLCTRIFHNETHADGTNTTIGNEAAVDGINTTIGFREATFNATGFYLNSKKVILRGFSDHNSFAGVGVTSRARVHLYRAQMLRAVGGNSWRMSHNPPGTLYTLPYTLSYTLLCTLSYTLLCTLPYAPRDVCPQSARSYTSRYTRRARGVGVG
jgi:beta-galactosidase/beta-glucuronidase